MTRLCRRMNTAVGPKASLRQVCLEWKGAFAEFKRSSAQLRDAWFAMLGGEDDEVEETEQLADAEQRAQVQHAARPRPNLSRNWRH